jgi:hypothetical protein
MHEEWSVTCLSPAGWLLLIISGSNPIQGRGALVSPDLDRGLTCLFPKYFTPKHHIKYGTLNIDKIKKN